MTFRAHLHWFSGAGAAAWRDTTAARGALEPADPRQEHARAYLQAAELTMLAGHAEDSLRWGEKAAALAGEDGEIRTRALISTGAVRLQLDPDDTALLTEAPRLAYRSGRHHGAELTFVALAYVNFQWTIAS